MDDLKKLFSVPLHDPSGCQGCSILKQNKPFHADLDFDLLKEADVAFVSDSIKPSRFGVNMSFQTRERKLIGDVISKYNDYSVEYIPSVRCPSVKEADITAKDMKLCREYLYKSLSIVKPKLVFACGNLPLRMLLKKSGITNKRGELFTLELPCGHVTTVAPIFNPTAVVIFPEQVPTFYEDVHRAYNKVMLGNTKTLELDFEIIQSISDLYEYDWLRTTSKKISVDLECEGLNFLEDKILTVGICWGEKSIIIPIYHKDHVWNSFELGVLQSFIEDVMMNPNNDKIFHNAKFDLKFLLKFGIKNFRRVHCTKLKYHVAVSENNPKGLRDLVKQYFPDYLETF